MSEIGTIGLMYEDRRTKKRGKLIERDEKYKTLLLESEDGKSFNVSFGGFKSNWRKCDEPEPTIEEAMQEVEIPEEKPKQKEVVKKKYKEQQVSSGYEDATLHLLEYAKSFSDTNIYTKIAPKKRNIILKCNGKRVFILTYMTRTKEFMVCMSEDMFMQFKDKQYVRSAKYNETWRSLRYSFMLDYDKLDTYLNDARPYVIDFICR